MSASKSTLPAPVLALALVTVITSVGGATLGARLATPAPARPGPAVEEAVLRELRTELTALRGTLERLAAPSLVPAQAPATTSPGASSRSEVEPVNERLLESLARIERALDRRSNPDVESGHDAPPGPAIRPAVDWRGLDEAIEKQRKAPKKAIPELVLWTPEQLLARFGRPTEVWVKEGEFYWNYLAAPGDLDGKTLDLTLKLVDNRVSNMWFSGD